MKRQTNGRTGPPNRSMTMDPQWIRIYREKHRIATRFISFCRIERKDNKTGKVAKGKRTTRGKTNKQDIKEQAA